MSQTISTVIVDDESMSVEMLWELLRQYCPEVQVVATANSVKEGLQAIEDTEPDLVFLDISMPDGDGFEILRQLAGRNFEVIFTTAYSEYAIRSYEFAALHYLLKPINEEELQKAVKRFNRKVKDNINSQRYEILASSMNNSFRKIALPSLEGISFVEIEDIIRCEASSYYTIFYLKDKSQVIVSKSLSNYEKLLSDSGFFRVHDKHLINLKHIKKYVKGKGGNVILTDNFSVDVSQRKKDEFLRRVSNLVRY